MVNAILVESLTKKYGAFTAVNQLSFALRKGETLGLLGTNGAGKTTTIKMLTGQLLPSSGAASVFGLNPTTESKKIHNLIGYIPDKQSVYDELPVYENIDYFRRLHSLPKGRTEELIEYFHLTEKTKVKVKKLSRGLRQRVLIARSIVHKPQLLILDEPTSGLDPASANDIYVFLETLKKEGVSILITTHQMSEVERLCDQIIFLDKGTKIAEGTPFDLKMRYKKNTILIVRTTKNGVVHEEMEFSDRTFAQLIEMQKEKKIIHLQSHSPSLDEVFIRIVRGSYEP
ncbi:MAG: ABC transporter ATP-binding protein [Bdellovibrionaceae bacterium]|nr:ABC transporter ATP-binding protein [Pseudobdellovibrionaceae bacterium]